MLNFVKIMGIKRHRTLLTIAAAVAIVAACFQGFRFFRTAEAVNPSWDKYPIRGIDISAHNGEIDFAKVRAHGYSFVIVKATEGSAFKDSRFFLNVARARQAGLRVGAYHFFRFDATPYMQALNLMHSLRRVHVDMPVVVDIEDWTNPNDRPAPRVVQKLVNFINELERNGYKIMIYTNKQGYKKYVERRLSLLPLWICSFTDVPDDIQWTLWQFTHSGKVDGVKGNVDIDIFNGDYMEMKRFFAQ